MPETIQPHILVVDDDPQIRGLLEEYFAENALRVSVAASGDLLDHAGAVFSRWTGHLAGLLTEAGVATAEATDFATLLISTTEGAVIMSRAQRTRQPFDRVSRLLTAEARRLGSPS